jgi:hypothetical protein
MGTNDCIDLTVPVELRPLVKQLNQLRDTLD